MSDRGSQYIARLIGLPASTIARSLSDARAYAETRAATEDALRARTPADPMYSVLHRYLRTLLAYE